MATFHYSAFHIRFTTVLKLNALLSQQGLKRSIHKFFAFIRPYPDWTSAHGLRILREDRTECGADGCARLGPQRYDAKVLRENVDHAQQLFISIIVLTETPHIN